MRCRPRGRRSPASRSAPPSTASPVARSGRSPGWRSAPRSGSRTSATIVISIVLAFAFGYALTSLPLLRAGLVLAAVIPIALASDTLSIATMEVVDNLDHRRDPRRHRSRARRHPVLGQPRLLPGRRRRRRRPVNRWLIPAARATSRSTKRGSTVARRSGSWRSSPPLPVSSGPRCWSRKRSAELLVLERLEDVEARGAAGGRDRGDHAGDRGEDQKRDQGRRSGRRG